MAIDRTEMIRNIKTDIMADVTCLVWDEIAAEYLNSHEYQAGKFVPACFKADDLKSVHEYFKKCYDYVLDVILSLDEQERNRMLKEIIEDMVEKWELVDNNKTDKI